MSEHDDDNYEDDEAAPEEPPVSTPPDHSAIQACHCAWCSRPGTQRTPVARMKFLQQNREVAAPINVVDRDTIRTQKARGMAEIVSRQENGRHLFNLLVPPTYLVQNARELRKIVAKLHASEVYTSKAYPNDEKTEFMARPCPKRPRHGFVKSQRVRLLSEMQRVFVATRKADRNGEMLLQHAVEPSWSAILTDNRLAFGPSNDGATSGFAARELKLAPRANHTDYPTTKWLERAGVPEDQAPYFEVVYGKTMQGNLVQVRAGHKFPVTVDFVPHDVLVTRVRTLASDEDEMAWEQEARALRKEPGVVVYHPGGSMISHFGVHCGINGVPYIVSHPPRVGTIERQCEEQEPVAIDELYDGLITGLFCKPFAPANLYSRSRLYKAHQSFNSQAWLPAIELALWLTHNYNADHGPEGAWYLGCGVGWLWRALATACLGEFRHHHRDRVIGQYGVPSRHQVFGFMFEWEPQFLVPILNDAATSFLTEVWAKSYGGLAWGRCTLAALRLYAAMSEFAAARNEETAQLLLTSLNTAVHVAHNGGWVFNKFVPKETLQLASGLDRTMLLRDVVPAMIMARAVQLTRRVEDEQAAFGVPWALPQDLVEYADDPTSVKRCEHISGKKSELERKDAVYELGNWLVKFGTYLRVRALARDVPMIEVGYVGTNSNNWSEASHAPLVARLRYQDGTTCVVYIPKGILYPQVIFSHSYNAVLSSISEGEAWTQSNKGPFMSPHLANTRFLVPGSWVLRVENMRLVPLFHDNLLHLALKGEVYGVGGNLLFTYEHRISEQDIFFTKDHVLPEFWWTLYEGNDPSILKTWHQESEKEIKHGKTQETEVME